MKDLRFLIILGICALVVSCGENHLVKEDAGEAEIAVDATSDVAAAEDEDIAEVPAAPEAVAVDDGLQALRRAEALGFAAYLPADSEALITFHDATESVERVKNLKLWGAIAPGMAALPLGGFGMGPDFELEDLEIEMVEGDDDEPFPADDEDPGLREMTPGELFGGEVTLAFGAGAGERIAGWLEFNRRSGYFQMRRFAETLMTAGVAGDDDFMPMWLRVIEKMTGPELYRDLLTDPEAIAGMERFQVPPVYFAVKAAGGRAAEAHEMLAEPVRFLANFGEVVEPLDVERNGMSFAGYRLMGAEAASLMAEDREMMDESIGREAADQLMDFIRSRELVALTGVVGDHAVVFFGASVDDFQLAEGAADSFGAVDGLAFVDAHVDSLLAVMYGGKDSLELLATSAGGLADYADGLRDGLTATDTTGRNRDLATMLRIVTERERALLELTTHDASGLVAFHDKGLRIEAHGGSSGMLDHAAPSRFAALEDVADVAFFLNWTVDEEYSKRSTAYHEALIETLYAIVLRLGDTPDGAGEHGDFDIAAQLGGYADMFESEFRADMVALWQAYGNGVRHGLGREAAVVLDLKGTMPAFPGVPRAIVENAGFPRVAMICEVTDRERLANSWDELHRSGANLVEKFGKMAELDWNMPRPVRTESGGFTSWFMSMPFFDDEFLPSVTLDDQWFAAGTSRNQAVELLSGLEHLEPVAAGGLRARIDFRVLADFQRAQLAVLEHHSDEIEGMDEESIGALRSQWIALIEGLEEFEELRVRCWKDNGTARTSVHLKTRY